MAIGHKDDIDAKGLAGAVQPDRNAAVPLAQRTVKPWGLIAKVAQCEHNRYATPLEYRKCCVKSTAYRSRTKYTQLLAQITHRHQRTKDQSPDFTKRGNTAPHKLLPDAKHMQLDVSVHRYFF